MTDPAPSGYISGTQPFAGAATDSGSGIANVQFQYRPSSGGAWVTACTSTSSPYGCSSDTTALADGLYDFRALATDNAGNTMASTTFSSRRIDNTAPTVTMNDPGAYLSGTISTTASAADAGGVASVAIQRRTTPAGAWSTICTDTTAPYSCSLDTTTLTSGTNYDFQAIATDNAGRQTTSAAVTSRMVDNAAPTSVTLTNPGSPLSGIVALAGAATDAQSGVATVTMQYSPAGAGTWSTACVATTSPYSCSFDTTALGDAVYDFRSVAADRAGNTTASATTANIRVDNLAPTVTMTDPGQYLRGTITAGATASDGGGIANVKIEYRTSPAGTWTASCTDTTSPYSCSLNTTTLTDGLYDFRATATDNAGRVTVSSVVSSRRIDNTLPTGVTLTNPGSPLKGTIGFTAAASDTGGSGIATVAVQYLNGGTWTTVCTASSSPYNCNGDTTTIPDGSYSFRSLATDAAGNQTASSTIASRVVDNTAPIVTMGDPGYLVGTKTLTATASDGAGAGVTSVKIQYKPTSGSTWVDVCTDATSPYSCSLDTTTLTDNTQYDLRAIATDGASWSTTSTVVAGKLVDNTAPTITLTNPGSPIRASVALASTAADTGSGIASVMYQYKLSSGSTWSAACTGSSSPWGCSWASTGVPDDAYDLRAIATDAAGNQTTSAAVTNRVVDNFQSPTGTDVQAFDAGGTAGKMQVNDYIKFTFSEPVAPGSILSGWNGTSGTSVVVRVDNFASADRLSVWNGTDAALTNLTTDSATSGVSLFGNYTGGGVKFNATMTMSGSTITVTFNSIRSGGVPPGAVSAQTMQWAPSSGATDLAGHAIGTGTITESGAVDQDF
jgi:hypothetical protein